MAFVNIPRDRDDPNYRYKMPRLMSKVEGRGNGIRTNIYNMGDIARALQRPPMYPTKFFGCELGAMVKFEDSEEKALISGAHNEQDLVKILDKFIQMYVLCEGCSLPEMDIVLKKGTLQAKCNACGYLGTLDNTHKAVTYMVKNPPDSQATTVGKKKLTKEERKVQKLCKAESGDKDDDTLKRKKSKDKKTKKNKNEEEDGDVSTGKTCDNSGDHTPTNEENSFDEDFDKKKEKAKPKRGADSRRSAGDGRKLLLKEKLTFECPEVADVAERLRGVLCREERADPVAFFTELRMLQVAQDFDSQCRMYVAFVALFKDGLTPDALEASMPYVLKCVDSSVRSKDLLSALEFFCAHVNSASLSSYPYVLQKLYKAEVLEAEDILTYYAKDKNCPFFDTCRKHAQPFLQWLEDAEVSSEEE